MNARVSPLSLVILAIASLCLAARASDWPQYRGPNHDGTSPEKILTTWPASGLHTIWKVPLNDGYSTITVGDGKAFTLIEREVDGANQEVCVAMDAKTGKELWASALGIAKYDGGGSSGAPGNEGGDGPRSTPAYDSGKVYTYSARMVLKCLDAATGKELWSSDIIKEHAGRNIHWENASSPLIDGDFIFIAGGGPGESLLAFDKTNGHIVWKTADDGMTHSTPVAATILGERQVIFFTQGGLVSLAPKTGAILWRYPFKMGHGAAAISPVVAGDVVYYSASYGRGSCACKITKTGDAYAATEFWTSTAIDNHWATPVTKDGYIYGLFGQAKFAQAPLQCVELATGKVIWSKPGFGPGGCTLVDGNILVLSDVGDLVLVKATPDAYTEITRSHILAGKCWNLVSVSDGRVYARSTKEGVCLDLTP